MGIQISLKDSDFNALTYILKSGVAEAYTSSSRHLIVGTWRYTHTHTHTHSLFRATPAAYGGFQAKGQIRAVAAGLHCSHSNTRSKPSL